MNHKLLGSDLQLFFFDEMSPGSCFFLTHGENLQQLSRFFTIVIKN